MKTKAIISLYMLLASIATQAADTLPQGRWAVEQITIQKITDGKMTDTYQCKKAKDANSSVRCPQQWEINKQNIVLYYPDGREETCSLYTTEGNRLTLFTIGAIQTYQYDMSGGNLTLTTAYSSANNLPDKHIETKVERWIITLKKY